MNVIGEIQHLAGRFRRPVVTLGNFDGVHLGHVELLHRLKRLAEERGAHAVLVTFDRHPSIVLAPSATPPMIQTLDQKLECLEGLGLDGVVVLPFTREFAQTSATFFVRKLLVEILEVSAVLVGEDFVFGQNRAGDTSLLREEGRLAGFETVAVPKVVSSGRSVSSTRVRTLISAGDMAGAGALLGRPYCVSGVVVEGLMMGRKLGFPTANVQTENDLFFPDGVYVAEATVKGSTVYGVASVGVRPTLQAIAPEKRERILEIHLLDFDDMVYDERVQIRFRKFLREERLFGSFDELKGWIGRDVEEAKRFFSPQFGEPGYRT